MDGESTEKVGDAPASRLGETLAESNVDGESSTLQAELLQPIGVCLAGRYRIVRRIASGGMGDVYLAVHVMLDRPVAVKMVRTGHLRGIELTERFLREAHAVSQICHENIVDIIDFGYTAEGMPFLVMEYLEGENLAETIAREGPLSWARVRTISLQILAALAAVHGRGIVHRDIKPHNCLRISKAGNSDFVKVLDFGIAKMYGDDVDLDTLTQTGIILGTALYMPPEQARSEKLDCRADIYSTGVVMYQLLTGRVPFEANGFMGVVVKHLTEEPPAMVTIAPEVSVSPEIERIVRRALRKERGERYQTAAEFAAAIEGLSDADGSSSRVEALPPGLTQQAEGRRFHARLSRRARRLVVMVPALMTAAFILRGQPFGGTLIGTKCEVELVGYTSQPKHAWLVLDGGERKTMEIGDGRLSLDCADGDVTGRMVMEFDSVHQRFRWAPIEFSAESRVQALTPADSVEGVPPNFWPDDIAPPVMATLDTSAEERFERWSTQDPLATLALLSKLADGGRYGDAVAGLGDLLPSVREADRVVQLEVLAELERIGDFLMSEGAHYEATATYAATESLGADLNLDMSSVHQKQRVAQSAMQRDAALRLKARSQ